MWATPVHLHRKLGRTYIESAGKDADFKAEEDNISSLDSKIDTDIYPDPFMKGNKGIIGVVLSVVGGLLVLSFVIDVIRNVYKKILKE